MRNNPNNKDKHKDEKISSCRNNKKKNNGTECLNTRFPLPTLPCAGYSVKLIYIVISYNNIIYDT